MSEVLFSIIPGCWWTPGCYTNPLFYGGCMDVGLLVGSESTFTLFLTLIYTQTWGFLLSTHQSYQLLSRWVAIYTQNEGFYVQTWSTATSVSHAQQKGIPWFMISITIIKNLVDHCNWKGNVPLGHFYNVLVIKCPTHIKWVDYVPNKQEMQIM
jgi:hypothetical protein